MGIIVECPNGHILNLKNKYAGRSGYCPHCRAKVFVPAKKEFSEDEIAAVLGKPSPRPPLKPSEEFVHQDPRHDGENGASGISLLDSSVLRPQKVCTECGKKASFAFSICPTCGTPFHSEPPRAPR